MSCLSIPRLATSSSLWRSSSSSLLPAAHRLVLSSAWHPIVILPRRNLTHSPVAPFRSSNPHKMPPSYPREAQKNQDADSPSVEAADHKDGGSQVLTIAFLKCDKIHEASRPDHGTYEGQSGRKGGVGSR